MNYNEKLNEYIEQLHCTAKELSEASGLSPASLSRYRNGKRVPEINSAAFDQINSAIALLASDKKIKDEKFTKNAVTESFLRCPDVIALDKEQLRQKLNKLISVLDINISNLCQYTNYEISALFRIRSGSRNPSDPVKFASDIAGFVVRNISSIHDKEILAQLIDCPRDDIFDTAKLLKHIQNWLTEGQSRSSDDITKFLENLNDFDLDEYINAIHFHELKIPSVPLQLPTSKEYFGIVNMMTSELDFLKATVLSKSTEPVIMYSDMPMEEMSNDPEFPKKWMYGMAMMLKKGLHLNMIHNIDRPFNEMMLGLESWIPMYMTGQVTPYYIEDMKNQVFMHLLKVSGTVALSGEAISGSHCDGKYYLTKNKNEVSYYKKRAQRLLDHAHPLMNIYRAENEKMFDTFLLTESYTKGKRRSILSVPPLYTMEKEYLNIFLKKHLSCESDRQRIADYADRQRQMMNEILKSETVEDEISVISREEFERYPAVLSLSGIFFEKDVPYTYEEYIEHIRQTETYEKQHPNYHLHKTSACAFKNLQIFIHEGKWAMVSKSKSPAIHFVIHNPKLRKAIERFVPPIVEQSP